MRQSLTQFLFLSAVGSMFIYFTGLRLHSTSYSSLSCHNRAKNIENYEFMITVVIFVPLYMAELVRLCAKKKNRKIIINN